jgi:hypothetical protein
VYVGVQLITEITQPDLLKTNLSDEVNMMYTFYLTRLETCCLAHFNLQNEMRTLHWRKTDHCFQVWLPCFHTHWGPMHSIHLITLECVHSFVFLKEGCLLLVMVTVFVLSFERIFKCFHTILFIIIYYVIVDCKI